MHLISALSIMKAILNRSLTTTWFQFLINWKTQSRSSHKKSLCCSNWTPTKSADFKKTKWHATTKPLQAIKLSRSSSKSASNLLTCWILWVARWAIPRINSSNASKIAYRLNSNCKIWTWCITSSYMVAVFLKTIGSWPIPIAWGRMPMMNISI